MDHRPARSAHPRAELGYGIKNLDFSLFARLKALRFRSLEMLINFNTTGFLREGCRLLDLSRAIPDWATDLDCEADRRNTPARMDAIAGGTYWREVLQHDLDRGFTRRSGRIMFPTAHDITDRNLDECLAVLGRMLAAGNEVLIVSKPHPRCVMRLCDELVRHRSQVVFRFSIGSTDDSVLSYWEPGAPSFKERMVSLRTAHLRDFATGVSAEPMLDGNPDALIAAVRPHVTDCIWLGKINRLRNALPVNCPGDVEAVRRGEALMATQNDDAIHALYGRHRRDLKVKWKDSIKAVVGLARPVTPGLDE